MAKITNYIRNMRYLLAFLLIFISFSVNAQNRFPSVDSAKNYVLRYVKNSAVETFTNWRAQNVAYGTLELLDSLASDPAVDSIWKTNDTLKYSKGGVNYTIGTVGGNAVDSIFLQNDTLKYRINATNYSVGYVGDDTATVVKAYVTNAEAVTITKGQVVYIFGASGDRAAVKLAKNTSDTFSSKTLGIVRADIAAGQAGWVTTQGQVSGINLGAYTAGDILWLDSVAGGFTKTKPVAPYHSVFVGVVERANAGNGLIYVKPQNGQELGELHDTKITSPTNNQVLAYTAATDIWENKSVATALGYTPLNVTDTAAMLSPYLRSITAPSGAGVNLIKGTSQVKRLKAGTGITITDNTDSVTIASTASGGVQWTGVDSMFAKLSVESGFHYAEEFNMITGTLTTNSNLLGTRIAAEPRSGNITGIYDTLGTGVRLGTSTSASSNPIVYTGQVGSTSILFPISANDWNLFTTRVRIPTLNDGTQKFVLSVGLQNSIGINQGQGYYFTYDLDGSATSSAASANWQTVTALNNSRTFTTTSTAVAANTYTKLSILYNSRAAYFYIDGVLVATHATNLQSAGSSLPIYAQLIKTSGIVARTADVDYFTMDIKYNTPR